MYHILLQEYRAGKVLDLLRFKAQLQAAMGDKPQAWETYQIIEGIMFPDLRDIRAAADKKQKQKVRDLQDMTVIIDPSFLGTLFGGGKPK